MYAEDGVDVYGKKPNNNIVIEPPSPEPTPKKNWISRADRKKMNRLKHRALKPLRKMPLWRLDGPEEGHVAVGGQEGEVLLEGEMDPEGGDQGELPKDPEGGDEGELPKDPEGGDQGELPKDPEGGESLLEELDDEMWDTHRLRGLLQGQSHGGVAKVDD